MEVGPLGLLIPKMPESGRAEVEAVAAAVDEEVVAARTAVRIGPTADEATAAGVSMLALLLPLLVPVLVSLVCGVAIAAVSMLAVVFDSCKDMLCCCVAFDESRALRGCTVSTLRSSKVEKSAAFFSKPKILA